MSTKTLAAPCLVARYANGQAVDETYGMTVRHLTEAQAADARDLDDEGAAYVPLPAPCQTHHCDRCGLGLPDTPDPEDEGAVHMPQDVPPATWSRAVLDAGWTLRGALLLCPQCSGPSVMSRDAELQRARNAVEYLMHALRLMPSEVEHAPTRDAALDQGQAFMTATDYLGPAFAEDPPRDRQIVAHAVRTLEARAGAVEDGILYHDPAMIERLAIEGRDVGGPGYIIGPTIPLADVDRRWIRTMSPHVGQALAALLAGRGSAIGVARAILFRPDEVEVEGDDDA